MSDPKTKIKDDTQVEDVKGQSILDELQELLNDQEEYRF